NGRRTLKMQTNPFDQDQCINFDQDQCINGRNVLRIYRCAFSTLRLCPLNPRECPMKLFPAVVAALLVTVGAAHAGELAIRPKACDGDMVSTIRGGKVVKVSVVATTIVTVDAANTGEIVFNPKSSDRDVVLTIRGGKLVKASVIAKPEPMAKLEHLKD